jgi:predicted O-methyltransferase YrrM
MEGYALLLLAAVGPGGGRVLEVGSYMGKSTCYLAAGLRLRGSGRVTAVDHFLGSPEHQPGQGNEEPVLVREGTLLHAFSRTLAANGLADLVDVVDSPSLEAAAAWEGGPLRLAFIDGDHSYAATRDDFRAWTRHLDRDGVVAFHDVGPSWPGVTRFFQEVTAPGGDWRTLLAVQSLRVVGRAGP